jgi:hypothetical protein
MEYKSVRIVNLTINGWKSKPTPNSIVFSGISTPATHYIRLAEWQSTRPAWNSTEADSIHDIWGFPVFQGTRRLCSVYKSRQLVLTRPDEFSPHPHPYSLIFKQSKVCCTCIITDNQPPPPPPNKGCTLHSNLITAFITINKKTFPSRNYGTRTCTKWCHCFRMLKHNWQRHATSYCVLQR